MTIEKALGDMLGAAARVAKGGPGSGNFGHSGRPGEQGGSGAGGGNTVADQGIDASRQDAQAAIDRQSVNYHSARGVAQSDANRLGRPMGLEKAKEYGKTVFRVKMIPADPAKRFGWETRVEVVEPERRSGSSITRDGVTIHTSGDAPSPNNPRSHGFKPGPKDGPYRPELVAERGRLMRRRKSETDDPVDKALGDVMRAAARVAKGGAGSGNFGHSGRPGERGGSGEGEGGGGRDKHGYAGGERAKHYSELNFKGRTTLAREVGGKAKDWIATSPMTDLSGRDSTNPVDFSHPDLGNATVTFDDAAGYDHPIVNDGFGRQDSGAASAKGAERTPGAAKDVLKENGFSPFTGRKGPDTPDTWESGDSKVYVHQNGDWKLQVGHAIVSHGRGGGLGFPQGLGKAIDRYHHQR